MSTRPGLVLALGLVACAREPADDLPAPITPTAPQPAPNAITPTAPAIDPLPTLRLTLPQITAPDEAPELRHAFAIQADRRSLVFDNEAAVTDPLTDPIADTPPGRSARVRAGMQLGDAHGMAIDELTERVSDAVGRARMQAARLRRAPFTTTALALDRELTAQNVQSLLRSTVAAGVRHHVALVDGPAGRRGVAFSSPVPCTAAELDLSCWSPAVLVASDGVLVGMTAGAGLTGCSDLTLWLDQRGVQAAAPGGGCPTLPPSGDGLDAVLDALPSDVPRCPRLHLSAESAVPWGDVAPILARLARRGEVVYSEASPLPSDCSDALPIDRLGAAIATGAAIPIYNHFGLPKFFSTADKRTRRDEPVVKTTLTRVTAQGGLSREQVRTLVLPHLGQIRHCYRDSPSGVPRPATTLVQRLTISETLEISAVEFDREDLIDQHLQRCIRTTTAHWRFAAHRPTLTPPQAPTTAILTWQLDPG